MKDFPTTPSEQLAEALIAIAGLLLALCLAIAPFWGWYRLTLWAYDGDAKCMWAHCVRMKP